MRAGVVALALGLCACVDFGALARAAKCDAGFGCGSAGGAGGGADGGGMGGGTGGSTGGGGGGAGGGGGSGGGGSVARECPARDGGWVLAYGDQGGPPDGSMRSTLPWGLATSECGIYLLAMDQRAPSRVFAELVTFDSLGNQLSSQALGDSRYVSDQAAYRLASVDRTLVASYPTSDGGGQLVLLDVTDAGVAERRRSTAPYQPQALAVEASPPNDVHLFGEGAGKFFWTRVDPSSPPANLGSEVMSPCPGGVNVRRAVVAPDGYVVVGGTYVGPCTIGTTTFDAGSGAFIAEIAPQSSALVVAPVPDSRSGEFSDISIAAGPTTWITYASTMHGMTVAQVIRTAGTPFALNVSSLTMGGTGGLLPGDIVFRADGGLEVAGTTLSQGDSFGGAMVRPDAGDYDAFVLRFDQGVASQVQTFGSPDTDGFTHVLPFGGQELAAGMCGYGGGPPPFCVTADYLNLFLMSIPRP
jgi:hypothetical protein